MSGNDRNCAKISVSDQRSAGWFVPSRSVGTPARHGVNRDGSRAAVVVAADVAPLSSTNTNIVRSGESVQEVPKRPRIGGFGVNRCHYQNSASQSVSGNDRRRRRGMALIVTVAVPPWWSPPMSRRWPLTHVAPQRHWPLHPPDTAWPPYIYDDRTVLSTSQSLRGPPSIYRGAIWEGGGR